MLFFNNKSANFGFVPLSEGVSARSWCRMTLIAVRNLQNGGGEEMDYVMLAPIIIKAFLVAFARRQYGTCFVLEVDKKQYLITAKHLVENLEWNAGKADMEIFHNGEWKFLPVSLVGNSEGDVDISVLAADVQLSIPFPMEPVSNMFGGQDVYFLGFPYPNETDPRHPMLPGFPVPFVKKGIVSYHSKKGELFLDGHNNPGFSGGPVVCKTFDWEKGAMKNTYDVIGVISSYRCERTPVVQDGGIRTSAHIYANSGIIVAYDIKFAVDMIRSNPIGFPIKTLGE